MSYILDYNNCLHLFNNVYKYCILVYVKHMSKYIWFENFITYKYCRLSVMSSSVDTKFRDGSKFKYKSLCNYTRLLHTTIYLTMLKTSLCQILYILLHFVLITPVTIITSTIIQMDILDI